MSFGRKACTCGGWNPDCYRCSGTGFYEPGGDTVTTSGTGQAPTSPRRSQQRPLISGAMIEAEARQLYEAHRAAEKASPPRKGGVYRSYWPWDQAPERQKAAWRRTAADLLRKPIPDSAPRKDSLRPSNCPICGHAVCRITSHSVSSVRPVVTQRKTQPGSRKKSRPTLKSGAVAGRSTTGSTNNSSTRKPGDGGVDGSYGWGSAFRDNGQFGSYPAFDPMDDESSS